MLSPSPPVRALRLGVAGLGRAFLLMAAGLVPHPKIRIVAAADPRAEARARFTEEFGARAYATTEELCADPDVEAIYIASPHQFHAGQAITAARHGKHVLVEKPMALTLEDCRGMIGAAQQAGVQLVVGHSHSFDLPIQRTGKLISSGEFGRLRMITAVNYTDFLYRPRRPEELASETGGGVLFNQAPHHVDVARLLAGSPVTSVRAVTGAWDASRATDGAYACILRFASGVVASLTYSGYAHFDSDELMGWVAESGEPKDPDRYGDARALLRTAGSEAGELALKNARNYGGDARIATPSKDRLYQHFGFLIASCEHADLRPFPGGIAIYRDDIRRFEPLPPPALPRAEVIEEFYAAVVEGRPPLHNGEWGMATMETCLAMLHSAREQREIRLGP